MSDTSVTLFDRVFAVATAFLLPGLIALFGIATISPAVQAWFQGAQNGPTFVGLLFVLFAALALNLVITALRWFVFERWSWPKSRCPFVKPPTFRTSERIRNNAVYVDLRHQHYYHYLAYTNTAVAIVIAAAVWMYGASDPAPTQGLRLLVGALAPCAAWILSAAGLDALCRFDERLSLLRGGGFDATGAVADQERSA